MIRAITPKRLSLVVVALALLLGGKAVAETYNVNAVVPYEAPTHPAVITFPNADSDVVADNAQQTITGTCQVQNPRTVVTIWRAQTVLGSAECLDGTFSIPVILHLGENNLIARTTNANGIYGPDSTKVKIQFRQPTKVMPLPEGVNQPTTVEDHTAAINQGGVSGLSLTSEAPFEVLPTSKRASIRVIVDGGQRPYTLQLKWGDGSTESHTIDQPGTYEFDHVYTTHKSYSVYAGVRDVLGAYTEYVYAVVSGTKTPSTTATNSDKTPTTTTTTTQAGPWRFIGIVWYCWIFIIFVVVFLLSSYFLGYRRGREQAQVEAERKAVAAKKRKKKKTNKK